MIKTIRGEEIKIPDVPGGQVERGVGDILYQNLFQK
jgi:hypothetical protein